MQHPPQPAIWSIAKNLSRGMKCKDLVSGQARGKKAMGLNGSMDWFKGKSTGNHGFYHQIWCPLNGDLRVIRVASRRRERKEAGLLGPTKSRLGLNLALLGLKLGRTGAHLGQTWASLEPNSGQLAPTWALEHDWGLTWRNLGTFGRKLPPKRPNLAQLGPNLAQLGPKLYYLGWVQVEHKLAPIGHVGLKLGPKHSRWTPNRPKWRSLGRFGDSFAPSWAQRRHNMGTSENGRFEDVGSGRLRPQFWSHMDLNLGWSCSQMGSSWGQVVLSRSQVGPKLEPSRANVTDMLDRNGAFGRFWADLRNVQITTVPCIFWRLARANVAPTRSLSCTGLTDLSVASTPTLSRPSTFGAGVFNGV